MRDSSKSTMTSTNLVISLAMLFCFAFSTSYIPAWSQNGEDSRETGESANPSKDPNRPVKDKWALVIGISEYQDPEYNLRFPAKDATDFAATLIEDMNFQPDHVKLLINKQATRKNILSLLGDIWLPRVAHEDDLVLIYISSHGSPSSADVGKVNYVVAHDTDLKSLYATGIPMQDLVRIIKDRVKSDRIVIVLDSCHSGAAGPASESKGLFRAGNVDADELAQGTGQLVISSSLPQERSWESKRYDGSVFTKHLIDGLKNFGDSTRLSEVFRYTKLRVKEEVERDRGVSQTPVLKSKWNGDELILATNPQDPHPGINISIGEVKVVVMPAGSDVPPSSTQKDNSELELEPDPEAGKQQKSSSPLDLDNKEEETASTTPGVVLKKLPDRFRIKIKCHNNVMNADGTYTGIFEWDQKKIRYNLLWDNKRKGVAHVEKLENNKVLITEATKSFWGTCKNRYEGEVKSANRVEGTMKGHDNWTNWKGTFEIWWQ